MADRFRQVPGDLLQNLIECYVAPCSNSLDLDFQPIPTALIILPFVSKHFHSAVRAIQLMPNQTRVGKLLNNFSNLPSSARATKQREILARACASEPISVVRWLWKYLRYHAPETALSVSNVFSLAAARCLPELQPTSFFAQLRQDEPHAFMDWPGFLLAAVEHHNLLAVEWAVENGAAPDWNEIACAAAAAGDLKILQLVFRHTKCNIDHIASGAMHCGNVEMIQFVEELAGKSLSNWYYILGRHSKSKITREALEYAENQRWFDEALFMGVEQSLATQIAGGGDLALLKYFHSKHPGALTEYASHAAFYNAHAEILKWLIADTHCPLRLSPSELHSFLSSIHKKQRHWSEVAEVLQIIHRYFRDESTFKLVSCFFFLPASIWRVLSTDYKLTPSEKDLCYLSLWSSSHTLEAVQCLLDDLKVPLPQRKDIERGRARMRKDVWRFLQERLAEEERRTEESSIRRKTKNSRSIVF